MKVIFLCKDDWANMGYTYSKSLNKIGIYSKSFCQIKHIFGYPEHSKLYSNLLKNEVEEADVVIFIHSKFVETGVDLSKKIVGVMHTGTTYRQFHKEVNKVFDPIVDITFCGSDVLGFNPKNEVCLQPAIDTDFFQPIYSNFLDREKMIIAHYPTSPKGYEIIQKVIDSLNQGEIEFRYNPKTVPFDDHIKRVSECDIYIEDMHDKQNGIPLTAFGITTLECACLGKIVCTRFPDLPIYEKFFGKCGVQVTNNKTELREKLNWLLSIPKDEIIELQKLTRKWVEERHSFEVIGNWLKEQLEKVEK